MEINRGNILEVLGTIIEPDLKKDILSLNLVEHLGIEGDRIEVTVSIYNTALHAKKRMQEDYLRTQKRHIVKFFLT